MLGFSPISDQPISSLPSSGAVTYTLVCDVGAYTYAGQDATLNVGRGLVCDVGAYVYAGQAATLNVGRTLVCAVGAYTYAGQDATLTYVSSTPQQQGGGGWLPQFRRRTRQELHAERVRLGILPADIEQAAGIAVAEVQDKPDPIQAYRHDPEETNRVFMRELGVTKMLPDYTRAIQIRLQQLEQEDEEILLLM